MINPDLNHIDYSFTTKLHNNQKSQKDLADITTLIQDSQDNMKIEVTNIKNRTRLNKPIISIHFNNRQIFNGTIQQLSDILV